MGPLLRVSQVCSQGVNWAVFLSGGLTGERVLFQLHSVCLKDSIPCVCRTEDLGLCWFLAGGHLQLLETTHSSAGGLSQHDQLFH